MEHLRLRLLERRTGEITDIKIKSKSNAYDIAELFKDYAREEGFKYYFYHKIPFLPFWKRYYTIDDLVGEPLTEQEVKEFEKNKKPLDE